MKKVLLDSGKVIEEPSLIVLTRDGAVFDRDHPALAPEGTVPADMQERMYAGLPPVIRRTPRARFEQVLQMLINDARSTFQRTGYIAWPKSIVAELKAIGWKEGKPNMWAEVEMLARKYVEQSANRQREVDGKSVTRSWHGHSVA